MEEMPRVARHETAAQNREMAGQLATRLDTLCHELSDRLDALARYDRRLAGAATDMELRFWEKLKELERDNVERLKRFVLGHLEKIEYYESLLYPRAEPEPFPG